MARSPFTLAAAVTAAVPGAQVTGARSLTADGDGRFDSAVATLADGRELVIRAATDDVSASELAAEAIALRALTTGARSMLPFDVPEYAGESAVGAARALVTTLLPGYQIEGAEIPGGRGAATSIGAAIAAVHALPASVVRAAGLVARTPAETRDDLRALIDRAAATGKVPARLTVRWLQAVNDDTLWRFESCVTLGGAHELSFVFTDDALKGPTVTGVIGWHGLAIGDPAIDMAWLSAAPQAAPSVHDAYTRASERAPDDALELRAKLLAELEFARWLIHGDTLRRPDIVEDATGLLESLAESVREGELAMIPQTEDVDSAIDALDRIAPTIATAGATAVDTSMQTDAYDPRDVWLTAGDDDDDRPQRDGTPDENEDEAQRAARAALHRWTSSSSE